MRERKGGSIINIASLSALRPGLNQSHYNSSNAAVIALTQSLAVELAPHAIRVNAVSPGLIERAIRVVNSGVMVGGTRHCANHVVPAAPLSLA